jgi:ubiquitin C-terminal hydrolase
MFPLVLTNTWRLISQKSGNSKMVGPFTFFAGWLFLAQGYAKSNQPSLFPVQNLNLKCLGDEEPSSKLGSMSLLPVGLINLRNTCYMNSILQSLFSVRQFSLAVVIGAFNFTEESVGEEVQSLFEKMQAANGQQVRLPISPFALAKKLKIDITQQEDAEELLLKVVNGMDESLLASKVAGEKSLRPSDALRIEKQQSITCINVNHTSTKKLNYFDLSVPIKGMQNLSQAIAAYFEPELLTGEEKYKCSQHGLQDAEKKMTITKFPRVLAVHLKRFSFDPETFQFRKIIDPLDIPLQLNMRSYSDPEHVPADLTAGLYNLSAVVMHEGSLEYGHYYTFAKVPRNHENSEDMHWVKLNDQQVQEVDEEFVLTVAKGVKRTNMLNSMFSKMMDADTSTNAYLLFYTQQD